MKKKNRIKTVPLLFLALLGVIAVGGGGLVRFVSFGFAAEEVSVPTISVNPDIYYPLDELLYLEGRAKPNSTVQIQFQKQGAKLLKVVAKSDQNGEWVFAEKAPLAEGDWEVRARLVEGEKTSEWSNPRIIKAVATGIMLGGVTIKFTVIFLLFLFAVIVILYLLWHIRRTARDRTEGEIQQDFSELRRDITEELRHLESKRELTKEEAEHRDKLLRELEQAEKAIERKLKNI